MPLIEELPTTAVHRATHGWAYVPDTGPLQIPAVQLGNRKRGAGATSTATASATAKQQKAIQQRLDSLDKENYKDGVTVAVPPRSDRKHNNSKKMNSNVRRILTYQRAFAHYLADEEANAQNAATTAPQSIAPVTTQSSRAGTSSKRKSNVNDATATSTPPTPATGPARRGRPPNKSKDKTKSQPAAQEPKIKDEDVQMTDINDDNNNNNPPSSSTKLTTSATPATTSTPISSTILAPPAPHLPAPTQSKPPYDPSLDRHPLLRTTDVPKMPSDRVMQLLISEPPLSYTAARATYPTTGAEETTAKPARHFCGVCGYWGRVKCRKCSEWTCGIMECWKGHEGVCVAVGMYS